MPSGSNVVFVDRPGDVPSAAESDDPLYVTLDERTARELTTDGRRCRSAGSYVSGNTERLVGDEDFDRMRSWLSGFWSADGIDLGPLLQDTFINYYAHELLRQCRLVDAVLATESPTSVRARVRARPRYEWLDLGSSSLYGPVVQDVCSARSVSVEVDLLGWRDRLADAAFERAGGRLLRGADRIATRYRRLRDDGRSDGPHDVVVFLSNTNNVDTVAPVVEGLEGSDLSTLVVHQSHGFFTVDSGVAGAVADLGVPVRSFESYWSADVEEAVSESVDGLRDQWRTLQRSPSERPTVEVDGINLWGSVSDRLWLYHAVQFPRLVRYVRTAGRILDEASPRVVLVKSDGPTPGRSFVRVAQSRDVPTLLVQHGHESDDRRYVPAADYVACWGTRYEETLQSVGVPDDRLVITGAPQFDHLANYDHGGHVRDELNVDEGRFVVTLVTQPFGDRMRRQMIETALKATESVPGDADRTLLLRPHPREDEQLHRELASESSLPTKLADGVDIYGLLAESDLVIAFRSTAILEASLLGTPVVVFDASEDMEPLPNLSASSGFTEAGDGDELASMIDRAATDASFRRSLRDDQPGFGREFAYNSDGQAAERVVEVIRRLATGEDSVDVSDGWATTGDSPVDRHDRGNVDRGG